ncbi:AAA family ATPase [Thioalkalivibrio sp. HK1]|uniref:AAA family ATPase n=1 Tax=Thioalkalivibrio sp. HK1 TaxID=1469245 RepID=UPI0004716908|nr:AAA family ATPase [Thioalkalivibrio sp. HK1]
MNTAPSSKNLTLRVRNFGPIIEANIDLRPLTVFAGPSNTGKSWLAILIYALHKNFDRPDIVTSKLLRKNINQDHCKHILEEFIKWIASFEKILKESDDGEKIEVRLPPKIKKEILKSIEHSGEGTVNQICISLGVEYQGRLIRKSKPDSNVSIDIARKIDDSEYISQSLNFYIDSQELRMKIPDVVYFFKSTLEFIAEDIAGDIREAIDQKSNPERYQDRLLWKYGYMLSFMTNQCINSWFSPLGDSAFYFPADRAGVMHAHRTIVSAIVGNAASAGIQQTTGATTQLSGVMADFLQQLINVDSNSNSTDHRHTMENHSIEIEKKIVGGKIGIERSPLIGYPEFTYQPKGWKAPLSLNNASSMVSEIAPIVLFLRHRIMKGDTLVIEEPEAHLHPKMQVAFTQQLAALVQSGVRVILTTHSDWVLQTIANMICASDLNEKQRSNIPTAQIALNEEQVGVWLFEQKRSPRGSVVKKMSLDRETGLYDSDYESVTEDLYGDSTSIYNEIQRSLSA